MDVEIATLLYSLWRGDCSVYGICICERARWYGGDRILISPREVGERFYFEGDNAFVMGERLARVCVCGGYYEARGSDVTILWKGGYVMSKLSGRTLLKMEFNPTRLFAPDDFFRGKKLESS